MKKFGVAAACLLALTIPVLAQGQPVRVRATVQQVNGNELTVLTREGDTLKIKISDDVNVVAVVPAKLADIKPGSFVGATAMPQNGSWKAVEVHIFPEALRGTGEGDRPFDYKPNSTMTNGTVGTVGSASNMAAGGEVEKAQGTTLLLKFKDGEKQVEVTPETAIVTYASGNRDELKPGVKIYITAATRQPDGTLAASRVNVGRGIAPPM